MSGRPSVVVFDVVETLMSLEPLRQRFAEASVAPELLERWFDRLLRDGMALTLAGDYEPFPRVADAALRTLTRGEISDAAVEHILGGLAELPAHPDAGPAMRLLTEHGIRVVCLSNGAAQITRDFPGPRWTGELCRAGPQRRRRAHVEATGAGLRLRAGEDTRLG
jgi:2-haloacid dehalogenase